VASAKETQPVKMFILGTCFGGFVSIVGMLVGAAIAMAARKVRRD